MCGRIVLSGASQTDELVGDWKYLGRELRKRTCDPITQVPFVIYVFLGIVMFGGLGVWTELYKVALSKSPREIGSLTTAFLTFFPALIGSTTLQLVYSSVNKGDKIIGAFSLFVFCIFVSFAIILPSFSTLCPVTVLVLAIICSICAVWVWWFANADDPTYKRLPPPDSATGGSIDRNLPGSLTGFTV